MDFLPVNKVTPYVNPVQAGFKPDIVSQEDPFMNILSNYKQQQDAIASQPSFASYLAASTPVPGSGKKLQLGSQPYYRPGTAFDNINPVSQAIMGLTNGMFGNTDLIQLQGKPNQFGARGQQFLTSGAQQAQQNMQNLENTGWVNENPQPAVEQPNKLQQLKKVFTSANQEPIPEQTQTVSAPLKEVVQQQPSLQPSQQVNVPLKIPQGMSVGYAQIPGTGKAERILQLAPHTYSNEQAMAQNLNSLGLDPHAYAAAYNYLFGGH